MEQIKELVRIAAVFTPGQQIKPVWFDWHRRQHKIVQTTSLWKERQGDATLLHFSVTDGEALYELIYNTREQNWMLNGVEAA